jgi:hypothetical protein
MEMGMSIYSNDMTGNRQRRWVLMGVTQQGLRKMGKEV